MECPPARDRTTNADESLQPDDSQVADYIRWFCFAVRADERLFILFEQAPVHVSAHDRFAANEAELLTPHGHGADGNARYSANVQFGGSSSGVVFRAARVATNLVRMRDGRGAARSS